MSARTVVGIDPGPVPGLVALEVQGGVLTRRAAAQCSPGALLTILGAFHASDWIVAIERFVPRGRLSHEQQVTADQVATLVSTYGHAVLRPAAAVKPWATDDRLAAAELLEVTKGMRHARDAARHALFAAVRDGGLRDPLSARAS